MMRYILIQILFALTLFNQVEANVNDTLLEWKADYRIKWHDFQGEPNAVLLNDSIKAVTSTVILYSLSSSGGKVVYEVHCFMDRKKSWTVQKDSNLLNHERIHFDITELYKRKIAHAFDSLNIVGVDDFAVYSSIAKRIKKQEKLRQESYDSQTWLGTFKDIQAIWEEEIEAELKALPMQK